MSNELTIEELKNGAKLALEETKTKSFWLQVCLLVLSKDPTHNCIGNICCAEKQVFINAKKIMRKYAVYTRDDDDVIYKIENKLGNIYSD